MLLNELELELKRSLLINSEIEYRKMKKIKLKYIIALLFFVIYFNLFIYIDISKGAVIKIAPFISISELIKTKKAIKLIKKVSNEEYIKLCRNVNKIDLNMLFCPASSDGCYRGGSNISKKSITIQGSDILINELYTVDYIAEIISHETCHVIQNAENRDGDEKECYEVNRKLGEQIKKYRKK
jgi:hypothetical protein